MSDLLRSFLSAWLEWVERGAPDARPFERDDGLCCSVFRFTADSSVMTAIQIELADTFRASGLPTRYPWGHDEYDAAADNRGLRWRLKCLNDHMRPLRPGDALIWAGRPGKGKTSSLIGEVTFMAPQFDDYYGPDHGRSVLWMNNEGPGRRIKQRAYQSALNATHMDMLQMQSAGTLQYEYDMAIGAPNRFRVFNIHGKTNKDVERIARDFKPGLIVFDMVDKISFTGALANKGERTDQVLEAMYDWARDLGVYHECPVISTSQTSGAAAGMPFPSDDMLKDSKTGKQGACDGIIMLGTSKDEAYPDSRFISIVKTKMGVPGMPDSPNLEVTFDKERCRLVMPTDAE